MAWRFRKRVKIIPGVYLNFSTKGVSTTLGLRGLNVNLGSKGAYLNQGISGLGLYNRTKIGGQQPQNIEFDTQKEQSDNELNPVIDKLLRLTSDIEAHQIKSESIEEITSPGLDALRRMIVEAQQEKSEIWPLVQKALDQLEALKSRVRSFDKFLIRHVFSSLIQEINTNIFDKEEEVLELLEQFDLATIPLNINLGQLEPIYEKLNLEIEALARCEKFWDITASRKVAVGKKFGASLEVERRPVRIAIEDVDLLSCQRKPLHFENANGGDLYLFPGFILVKEDNVTRFGLIDLREVEFEYSTLNFHETDAIPSDGKLMGTTWAKVNKDGSPDLRFTNNYKIPVVQYGTLTFKSKSGMNERYLVSNSLQTQRFGIVLNEYIEILKKCNISRT